MKYFNVSPNGEMIKVGEDKKTAIWYYLGSFKSQINVNTLKENDFVTIKFEKRGGSNFLTAFSLGENVIKEQKQETTTEVKTQTENKQEPDTQTEKVPDDDKWLAKDLRIQRQAIGKMTAKALIALQGIITVENVIDLIDKIYNKFREKVEGK